MPFAWIHAIAHTPTAWQSLHRGAYFFFCAIWGLLEQKYTWGPSQFYPEWVSNIRSNLSTCALPQWSKLYTTLLQTMPDRFAMVSTKSVTWSRSMASSAFYPFWVELSFAPVFCLVRARARARVCVCVCVCVCVRGCVNVFYFVFRLYVTLFMCNLIIASCIPSVF